MKLSTTVTRSPHTPRFAREGANRQPTSYTGPIGTAGWLTVLVFHTSGCPPRERDTSRGGSIRERVGLSRSGPSSDDGTPQASKGSRAVDLNA
jgi:hypothetical protein